MPPAPEETIIDCFELRTVVDGPIFGIRYERNTKTDDTAAPIGLRDVIQRGQRQLRGADCDICSGQCLGLLSCGKLL